jgi:hypothetical protein
LVAAVRLLGVILGPVPRICKCQCNHSLADARDRPEHDERVFGSFVLDLTAALFVAVPSIYVVILMR